MAQAQALALALRHEPLVAIYSSPLIRALQTARIVGGFHPLAPLLTDWDLAEMDLGDFDGMEAETWAASHADFMRAWRDRPSQVRMPGGECLADVQRRALGALARAAGRHAPGECLLLASHNFVILTLLCRALEIPLDRFREVRQGTAALTRLCLQGERLWAERVDDRSHLQEEGWERRHG
jgi:broad specificity phosphatase PhoE